MRISRHARNNVRLYRISREEIEETIHAPDRIGKEGRYTVAHKTFPGRFGSLPLKVVYVVEREAVVIFAYPLRRVWWRRRK
jgi:hypothetical protein